jgi:hypothetical protein
MKRIRRSYMNRKSSISFFVVPLLLIMAGISTAGVNVNLNIGPPPVYTFAAPPELVVIPNTYVYFAPVPDVDIVFYHGYWYRPYNGYWYRGSGYNGPWNHIGRERVPGYIINLPPNYRHTYYNNPRIPYGHVHSNWNRWEREHYWDKRGWKHDQNEWKQEQHQDKRGQRQDMHQDKREQHQEMKQGRQDMRQDKKQDHREIRQGKNEQHKEKGAEKQLSKGEGKEKKHVNP